MSIVKLATALFVAALALPALAGQSLIEQGRSALNRGDSQAAAGILEKAVAQNPNNSEAHLLLGQAYGNLAQRASIFSQPGLAKKTKNEFDRAVQLDPNNFVARYSLVEFYSLAPGIMGGSNAKAAEQANELKKRDALWGHRAWAFIHLQERKPELARKEYVDYVREQPASPKPHYWLGIYSMLTDKNYKAAMQEYETALKLDPKFMMAWFQIGHTVALQGSDYARGEDALRKYLGYTPKADEPSIARAHYWLGQIYEKQGRKAEARQSYTMSLRLNPEQKDVQEALKRVS